MLRQTPSTSVAAPACVKTGVRAPPDVSMLATSRSADDEFEPWANT